MHEGELGGPFYRRPEAVAVNGDLRRVITAVLWLGSGIRGLGIAVEVHRFHLGAKRAGIWCYGRARRNGGGAARRRQGARSVLAGPRRRCHGRALAWQGHAESQGALGGARWRGKRLEPSLAATEGAATAEASNAGEARRYRRQESAKRACGVLAREKRLRATRQGALWPRDRV